MCILSLHKSAKFGCFRLCVLYKGISDKWQNYKQFTSVGRFQPNFRLPLAAKLLMGSKKVWVAMIAWTTSIIMQNLLEIEWRTSTWRNKVWCFSLYFLFVNNAPQINVASDLVALLEQEIALVFVGRFRCVLLEKKSPFQHIEQIWKSSLGGATIGAWMAEKFCKIWENGCKVCAHHFDHL